MFQSYIKKKKGQGYMQNNYIYLAHFLQQIKIP